MNDLNGDERGDAGHPTSYNSGDIPVSRETMPPRHRSRTSTVKSSLSSRRRVPPRSIELVKKDLKNLNSKNLRNKNKNNNFSESLQLDSDRQVSSSSSARMSSTQRNSARQRRGDGNEISLNFEDSNSSQKRENSEFETMVGHQLSLMNRILLKLSNKVDTLKAIAISNREEIRMLISQSTISVHDGQISRDRRNFDLNDGSQDQELYDDHVYDVDMDQRYTEAVVGQAGMNHSSRIEEYSTARAVGNNSSRREGFARGTEGMSDQHRYNSSPGDGDTEMISSRPLTHSVQVDLPGRNDAHHNNNREVRTRHGLITHSISDGTGNIRLQITLGDRDLEDKDLQSYSDRMPKFTGNGESNVIIKNMFKLIFEWKKQVELSRLDDDSARRLLTSCLSGEAKSVGQVCFDLMNLIQTLFSTFIPMHALNNYMSHVAFLQQNVGERIMTYFERFYKTVYLLKVYQENLLSKFMGSLHHLWTKYHLLQFNDITSSVQISMQNGRSRAEAIRQVLMQINQHEAWTSMRNNKHSHNSNNQKPNNAGRNKTQHYKAQKNNRNQSTCRRCGGNHNVDKCKFKENVCFKCKKPGHNKYQCHTSINLVRGGMDADNMIHIAVMSTCGVEVEMALDSGAKLNIMTESVFNQFTHAYEKLTPDSGLKFGRNLENALFEVEIDFLYGSLQKTLRFSVVKDGAVHCTLLGHTQDHYSVVDGTTENEKLTLCHQPFERGADGIYRPSEYDHKLFDSFADIGEDNLGEIGEPTTPEDFKGNQDDWEPTQDDRWLSWTTGFDNLQKDSLAVSLRVMSKIFPQVIDRGIFNFQLRTRAGFVPKFPPRRMFAPYQKEAMKKMIETNAPIKRIRRIKYNEVVMMITHCFPRKPNGEPRVCAVPGSINDFEMSDPQYMPTVEEILTFGGNRFAIYFAVMDAATGYYNLMVAKKDQGKLAFYDHEGKLWCYQVMPFGFKFAGNYFTRWMRDEVLKDLTGVCVYIDDIFIQATTINELLILIEEVSKRLVKHNVPVNIKKIQIGTKVTILGWVRHANRIYPHPAKVAAIRDFPSPINISSSTKARKRLMEFLGMARFLMKCYPKLASLTTPLNKKVSKKLKWTWSDEDEQHFNTIRQSATSMIARSLFNSKLPTFVITDACDYGIGGYLLQMDEKGPLIVEVFSKSLTKTQKSWSVIKKEAFAIVSTVKRFEDYLLGIKFTLRTDHKPLIWLMKKSQGSNGMFIRWSAYLAAFKFTIEYIKGSDNLVADALSRHPVVEIMDEDDLKKFATINVVLGISNDKDEFMDAMLLKLDNKTVPQHMQTIVNKYYKQMTYKHGRLRKGDAYYIPQSQRDLMLVMAHGSPMGGHLGIVKTMKKLGQSCWWPGMKSDVTDYINTCSICLRKKDQKTIEAPPQAFDIGRAFERIHIDLAFPGKKTERGNKCVLSVVDAATKFVIFIPIKDKTAKTVTDALIDRVILSYGVPSMIVSDRGKEFCNAIFSDMAAALGIVHHRVAPYHQQANGQIERQHSTLANILRSIIRVDQSDWDLRLSTVAWIMNTSVPKGFIHTPFFLMHGRDPYTPISYALGAPRETLTIRVWLERLMKAREIAAGIDYKNRRVEELGTETPTPPVKVGDLVLVKFNGVKDGMSKKLLSLQQGPYCIEKITDGRTCTIRSVHQPNDVYVRDLDKLVLFKGSEKEGDDHYEVEKIVSERIIRGRKSYRVRFKGYAEDHDEWITESNLNAPELLAEWKKSHKRKQKVKKKQSRKTKYPCEIHKIIAIQGTKRRPVYLVAEKPDIGPESYTKLKKSDISNFDVKLQEFQSQ